MFKIGSCFEKGTLLSFKKYLGNYSWLFAKQVMQQDRLFGVTKCVQCNNFGGKIICRSLSAFCVGAPPRLHVFCAKGISPGLKWDITSTKTKVDFKQHNIEQKWKFSTNQNPEVSTTTIPHGSAEHWGPFIISQMQRLEESSRFHGYSILRWGISVIVVVLICIYLFRDRLRDNVADEVADVASRSMADENVVLQAHGMTKSVLERLINEPETIALVSDFVNEVLQKEDLRRAAVEFTASLLNQPDTQAKIKEVMRTTVHSILNHHETKTMLLEFIKTLIEDQQTKDACHHLLLSLTQDTSIQEMLAGFFKSVLASPQFQTEAVMLGREVTNKVVHDKDIQKETGDALWSAVKYGMTPYWFRGGK